MGDDHYFSTSPQVAARPSEVAFTAAGRTFRLAAAAGVFSAGRLDPGTAVLLRKAEFPDAGFRGRLLDLGCGYGPIACVLATLAPHAQVYAVDVNPRARQLAEANARSHGVTLRVLAPDAVPSDLQFSQIWSNPPIRVGKAQLHEILHRWLHRLAPDGTAWLVVARHLGADSLAQWLTEQGWPTQRHASQQGFRVLRVRASARDASANSGDASSLDGQNE